MNSYLVRFSVRQRIEHIMVMSLFATLGLTGLPQKYFASGWAHWTVSALGGIDSTRWMHRWLGITFTVFTVLHFVTALGGVLKAKGKLTMVPNRQDFKDAIGTLRYYLGTSDHHPPYDRYDYRQKFEYWGLVFGGLIMISTGFLLYAPTLFTQVLPGVFIPAAKVAHSNEGLMAILVVLVWHIYNAHLNPDVFPFDTSIFTGRISRERMEKEHGLELKRLEAAHPAPAPEVVPVAVPEARKSG